MTTLGKQRVRIKQGEPDQVVSVKLKIAGIIDELEQLRGYNAQHRSTPQNNEKQRIISIAQTKLEEACMFATKAIYTE